MYNNDNRFDLDLSYGQIGETFLGSCFNGTETIEVKTERELWKNTGNIAIEFSSRGKKSGILTTQSDYWFHLLADKDGNVEGGFIFPTQKLKAWLTKNKSNLRTVKGGDDYTSKLILVPISKVGEINLS